MKISYLFSRTDVPGSKLIAWASGLLIKDLEKVPSHVALLIELDNVEEKLVIESVFNQGVRVVPYSAWRLYNEECYRIDSNIKKLNNVFQVLTLMWGRKYDWLGIAYFSLCFIKYILFKSEFPEDNAWQNKDKFFCTEAVARLSGYKKSSMVTPAKMCSDLLKRKNI